MKKIFIILLLLLNVTVVFAYTFSDTFSDSIKEGDELSFTHNNWSRGSEFTKYITRGTGGYSEYEFKNKKYDTNTTYEFLYNNYLVGYNHHNLKFTYLYFDGKEFVNKPLSEHEVQELFPDVQIIKISEFKNNQITIKKPFFKQQNYLLWNDTDRDFYKYFFENYKNDATLFRAVFTTRFPKTFIYSHFGSRNKETPPLIIKITLDKNNWFHN